MCAHVSNPTTATYPRAKEDLSRLGADKVEIFFVGVKSKASAAGVVKQMSSVEVLNSVLPAVQLDHCLLQHLRSVRGVR